MEKVQTGKRKRWGSSFLILKCFLDKENHSMLKVWRLNIAVPGGSSQKQQASSLMCSQWVFTP
jgi:hypothetical protein